MNLPTACSGKPIFKHVFMVTKSKLTVKFDDLNPTYTFFLRYRGNCETRKWPVKFRDFRETGPRPSQAISHKLKTKTLPRNTYERVNATMNRKEFRRVYTPSRCQISDSINLVFIHCLFYTFSVSKAKIFPSCKGETQFKSTKECTINLLIPEERK